MRPAMLETHGEQYQFIQANEFHKGVFPRNNLKMEITYEQFKE